MLLSWSASCDSPMTQVRLQPTDSGAAAHNVVKVTHATACLRSTCTAEIRPSMSTAAKRSAVGPYAWPGAFGAPLNRWPLWAVMDHGWYLGVS